MKKMNMGKFLVVTGLAISMLAGLAQAETVLTWTDGAPNRGTRVEATIWMGDELEKRTNGELKLEYHWAGALMKFKAATKGIGAGAADMGLIVAAYNPKLHAAYSIADLPMQYSDPWVGARSIYELVKNNADIQEEFHNLNLQYITNITTTQIELICKDKSLKSVEDIDGLKVRGISVYGKVFSDLGATPVSMSSADAYQGLSTGLIDCTQMYGYAIPAFKLQEVANEVTKLDWGALMGMAYVMNKDVYDNLPDDQKAILDQLGSDFIDHYAGKIIAGNKQAYEDLAAGIDGNNVNIVDFPEAEKVKLQEASAPYIEEWRKEAEQAGFDAGKMYDQYQDYLRKYNDERLDKGYPWNR
ncbi:C4-dicarboxylate TRAP transporter substrate-binding protein [uncultured Sneathiella sp.]|uniref:C4-dicarboxylate TRAP transporter substrate-binding protein n=1 Tax=uncultured Sneathiella sp. TaxID=879315 RepID=UPI0030EC88F9